MTIKKGKTGLIAVLAIVLFLLVGGSIFALLWLNNPINKVEEAFAEGDVHKVVELYDKVAEKDKSDVEAKTKEYALGLVESYLSDADGADYETVSDNLQYLYDNILDGDGDIKDKMNFLEQISVSREYFKEAEEKEADGLYAEALEAYANVLQEDEAYYEKARTSIARVKSTVRAEAIIDASNYSANEKYDAAIQAIRDALVILPEDKELLDELALIEAENKDSVVNSKISEAWNYAENGQYKTAVTILNEALELDPDNLEIIEKIETYQKEQATMDQCVGVWKFKADLSQAVGNLVGVDASSIAYPFNVELVYEFTEDGEYNITIDEKSIKKTVYNWYDAYMDFVVKYSYAENREASANMEMYLWQQEGITLKEYFKREAGIDLDKQIIEPICAIEEHGTYKIVGNKLYLAKENSRYLLFGCVSREGNSLKISRPEGETYDTGIDGLKFPFTMTRVK